MMRFKSNFLNEQMKRQNLMRYNNMLVIQPYDDNLEKLEIKIIKELKKERLEHYTILLYNYNLDGLKESNTLLLSGAYGLYNDFTCQLVSKL